MEKEFICKYCAACCWYARPSCALENLVWRNGKFFCKIHDTDKYPEVCKVYPEDGECLRMKVDEDYQKERLRR